MIWYRFVLIAILAALSGTAGLALIIRPRWLLKRILRDRKTGHPVLYPWLVRIGGVILLLLGLFLGFVLFLAWILSNVVF